MSTEQERLAELAKTMFAADVAAEVEEMIADSGRTEGIGTAYLADSFYKKLGVGSIVGLPTVTWTGMDVFVFIPDEKRPFSYRTSGNLGFRTFTPKMMPTDGGTIPYALRASAKFSSWGFAPAFIIHDWLFHARRIGFPDGDISFDNSALVMAEVIKTLMEAGYQDFNYAPRKLAKMEDALYLMYLGVSSYKARRMWDEAAGNSDPATNSGWAPRPM